MSIEEYLNDKFDVKEYSKLDGINNISINNLEFSYPNGDMNYKLNYDFERNNCYLLLGENGAIIRLLSGLLPTDDIRFNNENSNLSDEPRKKKITKYQDA